MKNTGTDIRVLIMLTGLVLASGLVACSDKATPASAPQEPAAAAPQAPLPEAAAPAAVPAPTPVAPASGSAGLVETVIAFIGDETSLAYFGALQGVQEANRQGEFLGHKFTLAAAADAERVGALAPAAVIAALPAAEVLTALAAALPGFAVFNVVQDDDALRNQCGGNLLHAVPSAGMKADAQKQWLQKNPDSKAVAKGWDSNATKYAAVQLNGRFRKAHNKEMDDSAWAAWAAAKMTGDTAMRLHAETQAAPAPAAVLKYLQNDVVFDGQKGVELNFRKNGQLRQPLWMVEGEKIVGEAPVKGVAKGVEDLDSLGVAHAACE